MNLFDFHRKEQLSQEAPLAARMRPKSFTEFVGQEHRMNAADFKRRGAHKGMLTI